MLNLVPHNNFFIKKNNYINYYKNYKFYNIQAFKNFDIFYKIKKNEKRNLIIYRKSCDSQNAFSFHQSKLN